MESMHTQQDSNVAGVRASKPRLIVGERRRTCLNVVGHAIGWIFSGFTQTVQLGRCFRT